MDVLDNVDDEIQRINKNISHLLVETDTNQSLIQMIDSIILNASSVNNELKASIQDLNNSVDLSDKRLEDLII